MIAKKTGIQYLLVVCTKEKNLAVSEVGGLAGGGRLNGFLLYYYKKTLIYQTVFILRVEMTKFGVSVFFLFLTFHI